MFFENPVSKTLSSKSMPFGLEYHVSVRRSIPASVALFGLSALPVFLVPTSQAQINGAPASVTSPGFGGRAINGTPPSVTSLGTRGNISNSRVTFSTQHAEPKDDAHRRHHHFVTYTPPIGYAIPVPYAVDIADTDANDDDSDPNCQGGPTVFDRRGLGEESYVPPVKYSPRPRTQSEDADLAPEPPQVPTLLIFKDGRKVELENYAIVGDTLFDLTPGHTRKVAVADLDLDSTRKQNDDRGVSFQLPPPAQAN
jgi:hypothetical protein